MKNRYFRFPIIMIAAILLLTACRLSNEALLPVQLSDDEKSATEAIATFEAVAATAGFGYGDNARWPKELPADIPPLEGKIRTVRVVPGSRIRIKYSSITEQAVSQYLEQLGRLGYQLEYIIYTSPEIPDSDIAARTARGEWDAVDITKGVYHMRLEPGGGQAIYDIYTTGFWTPDPSTQITATPIVWPSEIPDRIPFPSSCVMDSLAQIGTQEFNGGYQFGLECTDALVQEHYVDVLRGLGLVETDRLVSDTGQIVQITLQDKEIAVEVSSVVGNTFFITVWPVGTVWPIVP